MRIAVALPSLEANAPQRRAIDSMLAHMVDDGHGIEGFTEHDRSDESASFPIFHYLRMPERHAAEPFDTALYPLGRDASPYQGVFALMNRFPGVVWFLDPIVHHLALGGIALLEDWAGYRNLLDTAYGDTGAALAQTVAKNWGTGALFRRYDLVAAVAAAQHGVLAAWPSLATRIASRLEGRTVAVAPLAAWDSASGGSVPAGDAPADLRRIAIMSVNESYATSAVRTAAAALERADGTRVSLCLSEPIFKAEALTVARHLGVEERIDWEVTTSAQRLAEVAADNDVLLWLAEELQGAHRLLLLQGLDAGKLTLVPRCPLYDDLPQGAVIKLDLGTTLAPMFGGYLDALGADVELRDAICRNGRSFARECPDTRGATQALVAELEALSRSSSLEQAPVSAPTWEVVGAHMVDAALPGGASEVTRQRIEEALRRCTDPERA